MLYEICELCDKKGCIYCAHTGFLPIGVKQSQLEALRIESIKSHQLLTKIGTQHENHETEKFLSLSERIECLIARLEEVEEERDEAIDELAKFNPKIRVTHEEEPMYLKFKKITYIPPNQIHFVHKEGTLLDKIINIGQDSTKTDEK
jgi:hypothetical protein